MAVDVRRLKTLVHYICTRCRRDPSQLGAVKLHKILWFADGQTYARLGKAIIGEDYTREADGPMAVHLPAALRELEREGHLSAEKHCEYLATGAPDISFLSEGEKQILDEAIDDDTLDHPAGFEVRDSSSHRNLWEIAQVGEHIPYQQQLVSRFLPLTEEDQQWIQSELERL